MDPSMESGNTGIQPVADSVETVEVVSGTERSSMNSKSDSKMEAASTQLSVPSSGVSLLLLCVFQKYTAITC